MTKRAKSFFIELEHIRNYGLYFDKYHQAWSYVLVHGVTPLGRNGIFTNIPALIEDELIVVEHESTDAVFYSITPQGEQILKEYNDKKHPNPYLAKKRLQESF